MTKEQIYDQQISPLIGRIYNICKESGIEMLANFYLPSEDDPCLQCTTSTPDEIGQKNPLHMLALAVIAPVIDPASIDRHNEQQNGTVQ